MIAPGSAADNGCVSPPRKPPFDSGGEVAEAQAEDSVRKILEDMLVHEQVDTYKVSLFLSLGVAILIS
jgi:hypothetical protein